jgi:murein DD-endopeptidase MepM/ murein hydrolase activator NlpD
MAALAALVGYLSYYQRTYPAQPIPPPSNNAGEAPAAKPSPAMPGAPSAPPASPTPESSPANGASPQAQAAPPVGTGPVVSSSSVPLVIPVAGVRPEQLTDTFTAARSEGRSHDAIDIIAPRGTPVLAAVDGRIIKLFQSEKGGITLYQLGTDGRTVYYYAHLERYADGMTEGREARRGDVLGYVGDTGNARPGNYHLHFQIYVLTDPKNIWDGAPINPYPLLVGTK